MPAHRETLTILVSSKGVLEHVFEKGNSFRGLIATQTVKLCVYPFEIFYQGRIIAVCKILTVTALHFESLRRCSLKLFLEMPKEQRKSIL